MSLQRDETEVTWATFWGELSSLVGGLDLTSCSSTKFDDLSEWLGPNLRLTSEAVVCKYVQHSKNRWNRLREALRKRPTAIVLFFDGDEGTDPLERVQEAAAVCPELKLVLIAIRRDGGQWRPFQLFYLAGTTLPPVLGNAPIDCIEFRPRPPEELAAEGRPLSKEGGEELGKLLHALAQELGSDVSASRTRLSELLGTSVGVGPARVAFKAIPSSKNLGNRLGEALARNPALLVVVCPEMLENRVIEEAGRWPATASVTLVLVLCGEEIDVVVRGGDRDSVSALRALTEESDDGALRPPAASQWPAAEGEPAAWTEWAYGDWNQALVSYVFDGSAADGPVERLAATPEELTEVVGASPEMAAEVVGAFVAACVSNMPSGRSFCGFCRDYDGGRSRATNSWSVTSDAPPHFFGMLWFTCLVAYGYPESGGGFYDRLWGLTGKTDHITCLPNLWRDLRAWTVGTRQPGRGVRELVLPPEDDFRTTIGFSHFLAFPHALDRRLIASVLVDAELVGFEPPITPVVKALEEDRDRFSALFREDLDNFVEKFIEGRLDVQESAFWRAVRQEALEPSFGGNRRRQRNRTTILALFDDDGLLPLLGCAEDWSAPPGMQKLPLDTPIGGFEFYAHQEGEGLEGVIRSMLDSLMMLGPGPRALVKQGVLVFQEDQSQEYFLVSGHEINGADVALVRNDLVSAFQATFGGTAHTFRFAGWSEVTGCSVKPLDELPEGLGRVLQLQRTMTPPSLRLVGGINVSGGYMGFRGFLPRVRAPDAADVTVEVAGRTLGCQLDDDEWVLPAEILKTLPITVRLEARWDGARGGRRSERRVRISSSPIFEEYKPLGAGHFFVESCRPGQREIEGGASIPLGMTTPRSEESYDLIEWEPSARYLGSGFGEMSASPGAGFDWLVIGPKKSPEILIFVGDPEAPTPPEDRVSPNKGDRRHWKSAVGRARAVLVRDEEGRYRDVAEFPLVEKVLAALRSHRPSKSAVPCPATNLDTLSHEPPSRTAAADHTRAFEDAIAALSARRSGLRYRTVQALLSSLTGTKDYALHHELIRAWADSGAIDIVRHQSYSVTKIVARTPRFVAVRRGPSVEASLIGLTTSGLVARVRALTEELGLDLLEVRPGNPWQSPVLRVRGAFDDVDHITSRLSLASAEWLDWKGADTAPDHLDVGISRQSLWRDPPPKGFVPTKTWSFEESLFLPGVRDNRVGVSVQQWVHREQCSIYVVLNDGEPDLWTYIRNWALLHAYDMAGRAPFTLDRAGWVRAEGRTPVHLPLVLGRLCAIVGEGVPGPTIQRPGVVDGGYCYPFGRRITEVVDTVIPTGWLSYVED